VARAKARAFEQLANARVLRSSLMFFGPDDFDDDDTWEIDVNDLP